VLVKRIFLDDGFNLPSTLPDGQDDPAISPYLSTGEQEVAGSVILLQKMTCAVMCASISVRSAL
jgi:hypothetical protein